MISSVTRKFLPGEEWLFVKVYSGPSVQDRLLTDQVATIVSELYDCRLIDKFFFIRYYDADGSHLRLRFHCPLPENVGNIIRRISVMLGPDTRQRAISKITIDTYVREIERYSAAHIADVETLFSINSGITLKKLLVKVPAADDWLNMVDIAEDLLDDAGLSTLQRYQVYEKSYLGMGKRLGQTKVTKEELKRRYRAKKSLILARVQSGHKDRQEQRSILLHIKQQWSDDYDRYEKLIIDLIHMAFNRYFSHDQNVYELVIYFFMSNHHKSNVSRAKQQ